MLFTSFCCQILGIPTLHKLHVPFADIWRFRHMDEMAMQKKYVFVYCCLGMVPT